MKSIPKHLQGILWSKNIDKLDVKRDANYIIHQILAYGCLSDLKWLLKTYPKEKIKGIFVSLPKKVYTRPSFRFVKDIVLDLENQILEEKTYVRSSH